MKYEVKTAAPPDLKSLLSLYQQLFPEEDYSRPGEFLEKWQEIQADPKMHCFIAFNDQTPAASCVLTIIPNLTRNQRPYGVIENVITDKKLRYKGFGRAVIEKAVSRANEFNCYKIMLLSDASRLEAHSFYRKLGFDGNSKKGFQIRFS